jgi:short-subunit dehydrogenase
MSFLNKYGKYALITGGTSGIGAAFADQLAQKGLNIVLVARRQNLLQTKASELTQKYKIDVKTIQADLTKTEDFDKVFKTSENLEIGLVIACAGMENHGLFTKIDSQKLISEIQLNVTSLMVITHHFAQKMVPRKRGGVLLVSSIIGHMPNPYFSNYAGTKAFVVNFGTSLNGEMKKHNIDVTVLSPGPTNTPMVEGMNVDMTKFPMTMHQPEYTAKIGLDALGKKPVVIPGFKNAMMVKMSNIIPYKIAIKSGAVIISKAMNLK